jgi:hypothetical protein
MATFKKNFNTLRQKPDFLGTRRKSAFYISFSPLLSRVSKLLVGTVRIEITYKKFFLIWLISTIFPPTVLFDPVSRYTPVSPTFFLSKKYYKCFWASLSDQSYIYVLLKPSSLLIYNSSIARSLAFQVNVMFLFCFICRTLFSFT